MLALRLLCPPDLTDDLVAVLRGAEGATHVVRLPGAALEPAGDVLMADLAREAVSHVVSALQDVGGERLAITLEAIDTTLSAAADRAEEASPGLGSDAVVWEEVEARSGEESELSGSFLALLVVAVLLAAVGVLLDSAVLIVGAMVVGPDFGPVDRDDGRPAAAPPGPVPPLAAGDRGRLPGGRARSGAAHAGPAGGSGPAGQLQRRVLGRWSPSSAARTATRCSSRCSPASRGWSR